MKIINNSLLKRSYRAPLIESIKLDNEISLTLNSTDAPGDPETSAGVPEYFNSDPFKTNVG